MSEPAIDTTNEFMVSARWSGDGATINVLYPPAGPMTKDQALTLAAYLVLLADPTEERFEEIKQAVANT